MLLKLLHYFFYFLLITSMGAYGQAINRYNPDTALTVVIDKDVIKSARAGLYVEDFINEIVNDTSFYEAFRDMKKYNFTAENTVLTYDNQNIVNGKIYRKILHQNATTNKMMYLINQTSGKLYKRNGNYQLYTLEMFDYIFTNAYNTGFSTSSSKTTSAKVSKNGNYKDKLKTLIFSPGKPITGIPFIASKTQIFDKDMRKNYNYSFASGIYLDSIPIYRFKVVVNPDISDWTKNGIMIKELTTIFDKRNFQILGRYIDMKMDNFAFSFDVQMNIEMSYINKVLLPTKISYHGNWDIPFKKPENASFLVVHKGYTLLTQK